MNFNDHKPAFDRDGYIIFRQFLPVADFSELRANLDRYIREVVPTLPDSDAFYEDRSRPESLKQLQRMGHDPFFRAYMKHPKWVSLAQTLMGEPALAEEPE